MVLGQGRTNVEVDDGVATEHQGGFVKKAAEILDAPHAAGRAHGAGQDFAVLAHPLVGVANLHTPAMTVSKVVLDLPVVERHVDHDLLDAVPGQVLDDVLQHRLTQNGHHRLGCLFGEGANAGPLPGRQDHCFGHVVFFTPEALMMFAAHHATNACGPDDAAAPLPPIGASLWAEMSSVGRGSPCIIWPISRSRTQDDPHHRRRRLHRRQFRAPLV